MKILFICGSLEPGKDGVGDYTRRLCGMLLIVGCEVSIIAYNDKHIKHKVQGTQLSEGEYVETIRLPSHWSSQKRLEVAREWIERKDPDWLSLQFVPYSYHSKGLPFGLGTDFSQLGKSRRWHVMFHELWIGMEKQSSFKHWMIGKLQRRLIRYLLNVLDPDVIHSQTGLYCSLLSQDGYRCTQLPLFSNIPLYQYPIDMGKFPPDESLMLVLFGHINPGAPVKEFSEEIRDNMQRKGLKPRLVLLGRNGVGQQEWINAFKAVQIPVEVLGEQDLYVISEVLRRASVGITTTPRYLLEKSGTVAAMRLYGLPIIGVAKPWMPRHDIEVSTSEAYVEFNPGTLHEFELNPTIITESNGAWDIAIDFYYSLVDQIAIEKENNPLKTNCESIDSIS